MAAHGLSVSVLYVIQKHIMCCRLRGAAMPLSGCSCHAVQQRATTCMRGGKMAAHTSSSPIIACMRGRRPAMHTSSIHAQLLHAGEAAGRCRTPLVHAPYCKYARLQAQVLGQQNASKQGNLQQRQRASASGAQLFLACSICGRGRAAAHTSSACSMYLRLICM